MSRLGNGLKTALLLGGLSALILLIGQLLGGTTGLLIAGVVALGMNGVSYFYSDRLALRAMRAQEVSPQQSPRLHAIVAELAAGQSLPMPRVYLSPSATPNAFATGRNPSHAAVCVTTGILELLDERELRGVLGHEISHVGNRDILANPFSGRTMMRMFSTHPDTADRITRLRAMASNSDDNLTTLTQRQKREEHPYGSAG